MKYCSTDARNISAFLRETWLRDQHRSTFAKLNSQRAAESR
jgi:hypothetical protein